MLQHQVIPINIHPSELGRVQTIKAQPGQTLVLVIDGVPYTGQKQINGKTIKLLRKGRALQVQVEDQIAWIADDFFAATVSHPTEPAHTETAVVAQGDSDDGTVVDVQTLMHQGGALQMAALDAGVASDTGGNIASQTWSTLLAQASGSVPAVAAPAAVAAEAGILVGGGIGIGTAVVLIAGVAVALGAGQAAGTTQTESAPGGNAGAQPPTQAPAFGSGSSVSYTENNTGAVYTAQATPEAGGAISYSISDGADSARFSINSSSGVLGFISAPDFENPTDASSDNVYDVVVTASESGNTFVATRSVAVTVSNLVETVPVMTSGSSVNFAENGTGAVYTALASASESNGSISYSISGGADSAKFSINSSGVVSFISSPNFESPTDAGSNNIYDLVISATEAGNPVVATRSVAVTVGNAGEAVPTFGSGSSVSFAENGTAAVYTAVATPDVSGRSISYSISDGADSAKFNINSSSGVVRFISSPNFEAPTDAGSDNIYDIVIQATEAGSTFVATRSVAVTVSNVTESAPTFSSGSSASFAENGTGAVYTAQATAEAGATVLYSISGGADSGKFSINSSGVVGFISSPNFESPTDVGGNNVYDLIIRATQAGSTFAVTRSVAVTVTDVNELGPVISSGSGASFAENGTAAVYTAAATPRASGGVVSYSISGGADSGKFSINSSSGVVGFISSPDFETPTDAGSDNIYDIVIQATEVGNTIVATRSVAVTVSNVAEGAATFSSGSSASFAENGSGAVYTAVATPDVSGRSISYSISGGADSAQFSINGNSGVVVFKSSPNFDAPTDTGSDNIYDIVIQATEAGSTFVGTRSVAVTVTDVADMAPAFSSGSSASFAENDTGVVYTAVATPDVSGRNISYSISGGSDSAKFSINSSGGVSFISSPDFETKTDVGSDNIYDLVIRATEAGSTFVATRSVAVTVTDVNELGPLFTSGSGASFAENGTGAVYTAAATPRASGTVSYSISGGADSAKFSINSSGGVSFISSPNFESPTDAGSDNVYNLVISATEVGNTIVVTRSVAVTVSNVAEAAPTFTSGSGIGFAENGTGAVYTAVATPNVTGRSISYSISGGADSGKFSINSSGVVGFVSSPDFEAPTDAGSDNIYDIVIQATESGSTFVTTHSVAVTVSNVAEVAPTFSSGSSASFAENAAGAVYTAVATPNVTGRSITFSISGGSDSAKFSINSSGVVGFISSPNFESPTDVGGNNVYDLVIRATESGSTFVATRSVAVTVSNVAEAAPAFSSGSSASFAENGTAAVYTAVATPNLSGGSISYSISGGADSGKFSINSSGVVSFISSPNFESPTDAGSNNIYDLVISATEVGNTFVATRSVAVTVGNVPEGAATFSSGSSASFAENATGAVYTAVATPSAGGAVSFSISGGADSAKFNINSSSGVVSFKISPNFEAPTDTGSDNIYDIVIQATESGNTNAATHSVAVTVSNVGDSGPIFTSASSASFAENAAGAVYTAAVTPDVPGRSITFSISGGADSGKFSINSSGVVSFVSSPNFESPTDVGSNNVYDLVIRATEVGSTFVATRSVAVTVSNVAEGAATFTSGSSASLVENGTGAVYTALARANGSGAVSYSISGGDDSGKFSINSSSGVVGFISSPDFETPTDTGSNNIYDIVIQAAESGSTFVATRSVAVTVSNVAEVAPAFTSSSGASFAENGAGSVYTAQAAPAVSGRSVSYSISGGDDSAKFSINGNSGVVVFKSSPNFELPTDADGNNVYDIVIQATESNNTNAATHSVAVTVSNVAEVAPTFTSGTSASFAENDTGVVYTAAATPNVSGRSITFSISGGPDSAKFSINSSGVVSFVSSPNFESPTDLGGNNVYELVIRATEAGNTFTVIRSVAVTVSNVAEGAATFTSGSSASLAENGTNAVYTALARANGNGAVSYSISSGADSGKFSINSSSGVVGFKSSPDFEAPTDAGGNNVYDIVIQATESGSTFVATRSVAVTVSDVAEVAPTFTSGSGTGFAENGTGAVYTAQAAPAVSGRSVSYSISGGADSTKFSINSSSGVVGWKSSPNFESPTDAGSDNIYDIVIQATESGNTNAATHSVAVTVSNVGEVAPTFTSGSSASFAENGTGPVYTAQATPDAAGASISYSISGGLDWARFSINNSSGVISFISSPNFESAVDSGGNNVYDLTIRATEAGSTFVATRSVAVTVSNVAEAAPTFSSGSGASFVENGTAAVYTAVATPNLSGGGISYSISGGDDSAQFSINSSSGVVGFISSPNFEAPTDTGSDNIYDIVIQATEVNNTFVGTRSVTVTVSNVAEGAATFTSGISAAYAENSFGAVYTAQATPDVLGRSISYSISGGADSAKFNINSSSGVVVFKSSPNFEAPTDTGSNNIYEIVVQANESGNTNAATRSVTVTVNNVGDVAPTLTSGFTVTYAENGTGAVYTAAATPDVSGRSITFSISGGPDSAKFSINSSGVVSFVSSPNFESPTDLGSNNVYELVIRATEAGNTFVATRSVAVTVSNVAEGAATFTSGSSAAYAENGTSAVYTALAMANGSGTVSYSISGGADATKFSINSSSGVVVFISSPDFETRTDTGSNNVYDLVIQAAESGSTFVATHSVAVTVRNVAEVAPTFTSASSVSFAENGFGAVYTAVVTPDAGGVLSYSISGGADSAKFNINSSSGVVVFKSSPNFEAPTDAGSDNIYDLIVSATEVGNTVVGTHSVAVTVRNVGEIAPTFTSGSTVTYAENGTGTVYTAQATPDVLGASISYSILGGLDWGRFNIDNSSGVLTFISSPNFESPVDVGVNNVYDLIIRATEVGNTFVATRSVVVTVQNVNETNPVFTSASDAAYSENGTGPVYTAQATSDAVGASISYSISGGADSAKFSINSTSGVVSFKSSPDFETKTDAGSDNIYDIVIQAKEGSNTNLATRSVAVTVLNVGEVPPTFTSGSSASFAENGVGAVYTAVATPDAMNRKISYSISGGADSSKFSIGGNSGVVSWKSSPNFEVPTDAGGNNVYDIIIQATESGNTSVATRSVAVTVSNVAEALAFTSGGSAAYAENGTGAVYTAAATPDAGGTVSYGISGGADSAKFSIDSSSGVVSFISVPDFENPTDVGGNNVYDLVIRGIEAGSTFVATRSVAVTVSNVAELLLEVTSGSSASFAENGTGAVYTAQASASDSDGGITYRISGGADSAKFSIDSSSGVVSFISAPDFETPADADSNNIYGLQVTATETSGDAIVGINIADASIVVTVTVTDVAVEAPSFTSGSSASFAENATGAVYTAAATPDAGGVVSFSISGGADSAKFSIDSSSGVVSFISVPDFENPTDVGGNNVYDLIISAIETGGTFVATRSVAVTVSNLTESFPEVTSGGSASFAENGTGVVYTARASTSDADGSITYSISGGADSAQFSINSSSGVVRFNSSPDFETPTDVGSNNIYDLVVSATESGNTSVVTRSVAVTVSNVAETPAFTSGSSAVYAENGTGAVYTAAATPDVGGAVSYSISGGADSAKFSIDSSSGVVGFVSSPNFEAPTDTGSNNVYDIVIQATESGNTFVVTRSVAVTVSNVAEGATIFTSGSSAAYAENSTNAVYTAAATPDAGGVVSYSISGGADSAKFSINSSGAVSFISVPDFEDPTDVGGNNVYDLVIRATEAGSTFVATRSVAVTVSNVVETAPSITSGGSASFAENSTGAVYTARASASDADGSITYHISGGSDSAKFSINSSGVVSFVSSPNHESPTDAGSNNIYDLQVSVAEASGSSVAVTHMAVTVTVTDVGDVAPTFTSGSSAVYAENRTGAVYTAAAAPDVIGARVTYSISGGSDSAQFSINSSSGVVGFISSPNFETPTDVGGNNVYDVVISATESGNTLAATRSVTVTVSDVGDVAPVFSSGSSASFAENGTGAVYTAAAAPDAGGAVSYSISGGLDSAQFSINSSSGVVGWKSSPDFEAPIDAGSDNVYDLTITATEAGNTTVATKAVAVTVTDAGDVAPAFSSASSATFAEGTTGAVYTAAATPDAGGAVSYSISGGADSAQFSINSSNGVVSFKASPNFETPTDVGSNNVYDIVIRATEANNTVVAHHSVAVTVLDLAEADPTWVSTSSAAFAENGTGAVYTALATANAGGSISYLLLVGDDVEQFSINSSSGVISFISSPNHESPTDTGANNVYDLIVFAIESDSSFVATLNVAVTVTDVAEAAPTWVSTSSTTFAENSTGAVYTAVVASDVLGTSIGYSISGGADSAQFSINSSSGVVSFIISPNHDVPTDAGANNVYDIVVSATEANHTVTQTVAVTVTQPTEADVIAPIVKTHHTALSLNGTASSGSSADALLQATAVGTAGEFVVSWKETQGIYTGVVVQKFAANGKASGSAVELDSSTAVTRLDAQVKSVGTAGEFVMAWGLGSPGNLSSIKVQKFLANGDSSGQPVSINPGDGIHAVADLHLQLDSLGTAGQFMLSWVVSDSANEVSMYVQKFDAMGVVIGSAVEVNIADYGFRTTAAAPQWTALGTAGEWVVLWNDSLGGDSSIVVQKIDANGSSSGSAVELGFGPNAVDELDAQATAVGTAGEFVVVWSGLDTDSERSVFVQKFTASGVQSGSAVKLEAISRTDVDDITPQVTAVGTAGEFVVVWQGLDNAGDNSIFVQKFNASGSTSGGIVQLEATGKTNGYDEKPQVTAVGTAGEFVVVWQGQDSNFENRVYVQQFAANGSASGGTVQLDAPVNAAATDSAPQVVAVGTAGEFVVTWSGVDSAGDSSVFVQKFAATGGLPDRVVVSSATELATAVVRVQSNELGKAYLVRDDISLSAGIAALTSANQSQWNEVAITVVDGVTNLSAAGLAKGSYDLYAVDAAGNLSQPVRGVLTVNSFAATFTSGGVTIYAENDKGAVYTAVATPNATGAVSYSISGGADSAQFSINSSSGVVRFNSSPNFEAPTDAGSDNVYDVVISATEADNTTVATQSVAVIVIDVGDEIVPTVIQSSKTVRLEATGKTDGSDDTPQITAVGTAGDYVVTWSGLDSDGDASIFVQKFHANGSTSGTAVQLEAASKTDGADSTPQITAVGTAGDYVVTWSGVDSDGDTSVFVRKFNANGSLMGSVVILEATGKTDGSDDTPQTTAVGTAGEFVVTWSGVDSGGDTSIFVQKFHANGAAVSGGAVKLEATGKTDGADVAPKITAVGTTGEFVVTWDGVDSAGDYSIFVQKFHANGTAVGGGAVQLESGGQTDQPDRDPQITAVGTTGEFVVVWAGYNANSDATVHVQKFTASGERQWQPGGSWCS